MINYIATSVQNKRGFVVHKSKRNNGSHDNFSYYTILFVNFFFMQRSYRTYSNKIYNLKKNISDNFPKRL